MRAVTKGIEKEKTCTFWWDPLGILASTNLNFVVSFCFCFWEWDSWILLCINNLMNQICVLRVPNFKTSLVTLASDKISFLLLWPISLRKEILPYTESKHAMPAITQMLFFLWMRSIITAGRGVLRKLVLEEGCMKSFSPSLLLAWQVDAGEDARSQVPLDVSQIVRDNKVCFLPFPITILIKRVDWLLHTHFFLLKDMRHKGLRHFKSWTDILRWEKAKVFKGQDAFYVLENIK